MTIRRDHKRKIRNYTTLVIYIVGGVGLIALMFIGYKSFSFPRFSFGVPSAGMLKPQGSVTTINNLSKELNRLNIVMDSLEVSSESGVLIGQVRDGPKVYFSEDQDAKWQIMALSLIISRTTVDNKKPTLVDLRSARPIVKF